MAMPDVLAPDAVAAVLDIGLVAVLVAMAMANEVVVMSIMSTSTTQTKRTKLAVQGCQNSVTFER